MIHALDDTIAAISTAAGGAARGMIRLSGPSVVECLAKDFRPAAPVALAKVRAPRVIEGAFRLLDGRELPCEFYLWPGARSYTRQPVAELHTLGSPPLLDALLRAVCRAGARLAEPGEFTLRAFLAGQLDLTQAEAVLGVIDAQGEGQLQTALAQLAGGVSTPMTRLRERLLDLLAHLEAGLDFVEEDIEFISADELESQLAAAEDAVRHIVARMESRGETSAGPRVVLVGWPNAGKSSLFNALAGDARAIVSDHPGTTRDYLLARIQIDGLDCELVDTAGVEPPATNHQPPTTNSIAGTAQEMTREQHGRAQLRLLCLDSTRPLNAWEREQLARDEAQLLVLTKADQPRATDLDRAALPTSSLSGAGLDALRAAIARAAGESLSDEAGVVSGTAARCAESLRLAAAALQTARALTAAGAGEELAAAELRSALDHLGQVLGAVYTDDVLDRVFSRFCIGK
jgi:tRNA modification GTPase